MATILMLVLAVAGGAALVWRAVPGARRRRAEEEGLEPFELAGPGQSPTPSFSFQPAPVADDLPPRPLSIARIMLAVLAVAGLGAALAWTIGRLINQQLERMLVD